MALTFNQVPPMDEVWSVDGGFYLVRYVESTGVPLIWSVTGTDVEALGITKATRTLTGAQLSRVGALPMGDSRELLNTTEDPVEALYSNYETEVRVKPWLADGEILALWTGAVLEGRSISEAEFQGTEWWRTHTTTERQWLSLNASDPSTANQLIEDNRSRVADIFVQAGVDNASADLVQLVADNWTQGKWSETYSLNQIRMLADPNLEGTLDNEITGFRTGLDTTRAREDEVRSLINTWLGPAAEQNWSTTHISSWATRFREDPDAQTELVEILKRHRLALFPEYENANLTYEDIAAPWRGVWQNELGQTVDETNPVFNQIVRANDLSTAQNLLRKHGLKTGNGTVAKRLVSDISGAFGGQVRRADPAIL